MTYILEVLKAEKDKRIGEYARNKKLFKGDHFEVFQMNQFEYYSNPANQYVCYNYPGILTNAFADLIWSEKPKLTFQTESNIDFFEEWTKENDFFLKMRRGTETSSYAGDAVFQVAVEDNEVKLYQIDNRIWCPIYDESNPEKEPMAHVLFHKRSDELNKNNTYYLLESYTSGRIEWTCFSVNNEEGDKPEVIQLRPMDKFADKFQNIEAQTTDEGFTLYIDTNCKYPLIFRLSNYRNAGEFFGTSDYSNALIAKVFNINQNKNQIQYIIKKHANPKMVVPEKVFKQAAAEVTTDDNKAISMNFASKDDALRLRNDNYNHFKSVVYQRLIEKLEFYAVGANDSQKPEYITWDGKLEESRLANSDLKEDLQEETQLAKVLTDPTVTTGNLTGIAILRLAQRTLHKATQKRDYIEATMRKLIYTVIELSATVLGEQGLVPEFPTITFKDGLINDLQEIIKEQMNQVNGGIASKVEAIAAIRDITKVEAEQIYQEIQTIEQGEVDNQAAIGFNS